MDAYSSGVKANSLDQEEGSSPDDEPLVLSKNFKCFDGWMTIRSDTNYKYLWMHDKDRDLWMSATATADTPGDSC